MSKKLKIHFIGIGGIGISALAQYYLSQGAEVSGSDLARSEITDLLDKKGAKIFIGSHQKKNIPRDAVLAIYSPAVQPNNPELIAAKMKGLKTQSYPAVLGELTKKYFTIAVSGMHGKSTTTAMVGLILEKAGLDPTVIIGTKVKEFGNSNFRMGKSQYLVIEADEWRASFLHYWPKIIVLTNVEREHLDYYKNLSHILQTFGEYINRLPKDGILVANSDDVNISKLKTQNAKLQLKTQNYSLKQPEARQLIEILKVPGKHNIYNALAALTVARILKIPDEISFRALSGFKGTWRRFEIKIAKIGSKKFTIINDYGHHPTEIKATFQAAREKFPGRKIWCVFQPHQYQRTFYLLDDFIKTFSSALIDKTIITDIYTVAGREKETIKEKVNSKILVKKINKSSVIYLPKNKINNYLKKNLKNGQVLIIMGAGDIYKLGSNL